MIFEFIAGIISISFHKNVLSSFLFFWFSNYFLECRTLDSFCSDYDFSISTFRLNRLGSWSEWFFMNLWNWFFTSLTDSLFICVRRNSNLWRVLWIKLRINIILIFFFFYRCYLLLSRCRWSRFRFMCFHCSVTILSCSCQLFRVISHWLYLNLCIILVFILRIHQPSRRNQRRLIQRSAFFPV